MTPEELISSQVDVLQKQKIILEIATQTLIDIIKYLDEQKQQSAQWREEESDREAKEDLERRQHYKMVIACEIFATSVGKLSIESCLDSADELIAKVLDVD